MMTRPERFRRYVIVGLGVNGVLYATFLALVWLKCPAVTASGICYALGVASSYLINRTWSYGSRGSHRLDIPKYLAAYGAGLLVTLLSMSWLAGPLGPPLAQIVTVGVTAVTIFSALELLRFGR